jgi:hypothetical protein
MMRRKLTILLVAFALVLSVGQVAKGLSGNLLGDPDFELEDGSWEVWTWQAGDAAIESDPAIQMDGKYLRATRPGSGSCGAAQQFDANEGDVFLVQGWIRTSVGATGELATMVVSWGDANYVPSNNNYLRRDESTQIGEPILTGQILDWTLVKMVTLPAPAGTVTARVECINDKDGNGDAYFDSIHVGRPLTAWGPNPADGAVGVRRTPRLTWRLGAAAVSHDVYFGTDFNDVADANTLDPQFINNQEPNSYQPSEILELNTTYYWRIDEVNDSNTWKGDVWRFEVASIPASHPSPDDGEPEANRYSLLSWAPGADANSHDVYFGTDFNDVNDANNSLPAGTSVYKGNQPYDGTSYDPGLLELTQTYYWRIDEVNEADPDIWKGDVWSFTVSTNLLVNPGFEDGFNVEPWSEGMDPTAWFKWTWGSGWVAWKSDSEQGNDPPIAYSGDKFVGIGAWTDPPELWVAGAGLGQDIPANPGDILTASVWARTELWGEPFGGLKVEFKDAVGGTVLQFDESFMINRTESTYTLYSMTSRPAPVGTTIAEFIIQATNQGTVLFDNASLEFGPPEIAWNPRPIQGAVYVDRNADLSWNAGVDATSHDVYFGSDFNDVNDATTSSPEWKGTQTLANTSYELELLEPSQTYYWRIDEVNGLDVWRGEIWRFTTGEFTIVDNFDSYDVSNPLVYDDYYGTGTWIDTWTNDTGAELFLETDPLLAYDGNSIRFDYENYQSGGADELRYSEIEALVSDLKAGTDWVAGNTTTLALRFYGTADNDANQGLYVALEDASGNLAVKEYDGDMNNLKKEQWQQWNIRLQDFNDINNVDLSDVAKIYIGFGVRGNTVNPPLPASGTVYFDDIMLYPPRCVAELSLSQGDFTGDCLIDEWDIEVMSADWLMRDYNVVAETLSPDDLVAWYEFEGNAADSSGNGYDGTLHGGVSFTIGVDGNAMDLDGFGDYMSIPGSNTPGGPFDFNDTVTVTAWVQVSAFDKWFQTVISKGDDSWRLARHYDQDSLEFACTGVLGGADPLYGNVIGSIPVNDGLWHHVAGVYDGSGVYLYVDGMLDNSEQATGAMNNSSYGVYVGANEQASERDWNGLIDDVRIYNRGLSHGEILSLIGQSEIYQPVLSEANIFDEEPELSKSVNFRDYAVLADNWLEMFIFPF